MQKNQIRVFADKNIFCRVNFTLGWPFFCTLNIGEQLVRQAMLSRIQIVHFRSAQRLLQSRFLSCSTMDAQKFRVERDTFGELQVPGDKYYGAQTAR
jgi:hypothetical protein